MIDKRNKRHLLTAAIALIAISAAMLLVLATGIDYWLQRNFLIYSKTPSILMSVLFVAAAIGVYRNDTDRARFFVVAGLLGVAACYAIQQWPPSWWVLYGTSVFRAALFWHGLSIYGLSEYRRRSRREQ